MDYHMLMIRSYSLVLLNNIFGGGASSILFQKVREELGLCYSVYSYMQPYLGVGTIKYIYRIK